MKRAVFLVYDVILIERARSGALRFPAVPYPRSLKWRLQKARNIVSSFSGFRCFIVSFHHVLHLLSIPEADRHKTGDRTFSGYFGMKNLVGIRRGQMWKRPVKIVGRTIRDSGQTLKEIELGYVNT